MHRKDASLFFFIHFSVRSKSINFATESRSNLYAVDLILMVFKPIFQ